MGLINSISEQLTGKETLSLTKEERMLEHLSLRRFTDNRVRIYIGSLMLNLILMGILMAYKTMQLDTVVLSLITFDFFASRINLELMLLNNTNDGLTSPNDKLLMRYSVAYSSIFRRFSLLLLYIPILISMNLYLSVFMYLVLFLLGVGELIYCDKSWKQVESVKFVSNSGEQKKWYKILPLRVPYFSGVNNKVIQVSTGFIDYLKETGSEHSEQVLDLTEITHSIDEKQNQILNIKLISFYLIMPLILGFVSIDVFNDLITISPNFVLLQLTITSSIIVMITGYIHIKFPVNNQIKIEGLIEEYFEKYTIKLADQIKIRELYNHIFQFDIKKQRGLLSNIILEFGVFFRIDKLEI
ncbi:MAG: hypothetical protein GPJ54_11185 [Candidatus Heimdallarchaeota archaeon]|nr:hypothetical protein [Candidatus Heimdallarchaeota archaeon]